MTDITLSFDTPYEAQSFMNWLEETMEFAQSLHRYAEIVSSISKQVDRSVKGFDATIRVK